MRKINPCLQSLYTSENSLLSVLRINSLTVILGLETPGCCDYLEAARHCAEDICTCWIDVLEMAQSSPSAKYKQHLSLAVDQSSDVLDATFHRTTSMQKNSSLFVPKKERQMAMKVIPYPPSDTTQEIKQERQRRSFRWMLGNVMFSAGIEKLNLATVAAFLALIYVDFGFDDNFADQRQTLDLISLALIALFFLEDCAKFGIIGFVRTT